MTWKLLKQLRPPHAATASSILHRSRFLNFHNATRLFSDAPPPLPPPSVEPPSIPPPQNPHSPSPSSLNQKELAKFAAIAGTWWDSEGPLKPLHALNPTRLAFIRSTLCRHFRRDPLSARPFEGLKFIDVGCGGGILSEPLARMGASVTGVDAVQKNIKIARLHAACAFQSCTEKLVEEQRSFDAVFALEVQEMAGFAYNPLTGRWSLSDDISVNFIAYATKTETSTS
ncbi:hypothetical protein ACLB2K_067157 [Fragaria x ananassa]